MNTELGFFIQHLTYHLTRDGLPVLLIEYIPTNAEKTAATAIFRIGDDGDGSPFFLALKLEAPVKRGGGAASAGNTNASAYVRSTALACDDLKRTSEVRLNDLLEDYLKPAATTPHTASAVARIIDTVIV